MYDFKFLIIGSQGLLGSNIVKILRRNKICHFTVARNKADFNTDLNDHKNLRKLFKKLKFDIVINCAGRVNIDFCEKNYSEAKKINSTLIKILSDLSNLYNFKLVHVSTDHIYKGAKFKLNSENSKIYPINNYAKTKILAEKYANKAKKNLIIRTNFTGRKKNSFLDILINNIKRGKKLVLFSDMYTSTLDVRTCSSLIIKLAMTNAEGIYNLGTRNMITKKQFAIKLSRLLKKKILFTTKSSNILKVPRGKNLGLNTNKVEKKLNQRMISSNKSISNNLEEYQ